MDTAAKILPIVLTYLGENWKTIAAYSGWMLGICAILQYIKRRYEIDRAKGFSFLGLWRMDGPRIMATLYMLATAGSSALTFFTDPANSVYIPNRFLFLFGTGYTLHRFIVSPVGTKIENKLKPYLQALKQLKALEEQLVAEKNAQAALPAATQPQVVHPTNLVQ